MIEFAGYSSWRTELELSHDVGESVGSTTPRRLTALAAAGIPFTIARFFCPPEKAEILKALRSVIWGGADHVVLEMPGFGVAGTMVVAVSVTVRTGAGVVDG